MHTASSLSTPKIPQLDSRSARKNNTHILQPMESHSEDKEERLLAKATDFEFITFTDINQTRHPETRKRVRSHVMHRVKRNLRNRQQTEQKGAIVLDLSSLSQTNTGELGGPNNSLLAARIVPYPYGLGAGRSNPFVKYPIDMNLRTHELFDHCKDHPQ